MRIGMLGTGMVGQTLASKLASLGHDVFMGAREADNERARKWVEKTGGTAQRGTFAGAAHYGEVLFNCTLGAASLDALEQAGAEHLEGKVLVDVSNPLDFSKGMPPSLFVSNDDSLAEQLQRAYPKARVVKALNTINAGVMVDPGRIADGEHATFLSGNDSDAKEIVRGILASFGWKQIIDLGDVTSARGSEMYLPLWVRMWGALGDANFNIKIVRS
jgi:8-hydroxy-5-deazaflavin:NADPH oxidoreductase